MNIYNSVFDAIKKCCSDGYFTDEQDCFNIIAREADVPVTTLDEFLETFRKLGLIICSKDDNCISLTDKGKRHYKLFDDNASSRGPQ